MIPLTPMKLHQNLALGVINGLEAIFLKEELAQYYIPSLLKKNPKWGSRDRRLVSQILYDSIRWKRLYEDTIKKKVVDKKDLWSLLGCWLLLHDYPLPDWEEFKEIEPDALHKNHEAACQIRAVKQSIPDWLDTAGENAFGASIWEEELKSLNQTAAFVIRVNRLKITPEKLQRLLLKELNVRSNTLKEYPDALIFEKQINLKNSAVFKKGYFEIQDANSQLVATCVAAKPGMTVIDACAGAGGKTLHLATTMQNKGKIIALDVHDKKLQELKKRATRNGVNIVECSMADSPDFFIEWEGKADRVLIDAPCSGLGVIKRYPDTKWKMNPKKIQELLQLQQKILRKNAKLVKVDGTLTYATCTLFPNENQEQIDAFLTDSHGKEFKLIESKTFFSHQTGFDAFFMATLKRINVNK